MVCINCASFNLLLNLEEYVISKTPTCDIIEQIFTEYTDIATNDMVCPHCRNKIKKGESYFNVNDEDFSDIIFNFLGQEVMHEIECCTECNEGADIHGISQDYQNLFNDSDDESNDMCNDIDSCSTLEDIMDVLFSEKSDFWLSHYDKIAEFVECPKCSNGSGENYDDKVDYGTFNRYTEVYTKDDISMFNHDFYGEDWHAIKDQISLLAQSITVEELLLLKESYLKNKTFAAKNGIFYKLECFIKQVYSDDIKYILSPNRIVFRTRTSSVDAPLSEADLWEPPYMYASHGRYNDIGMSLLYVANNRSVLKKEVPVSTGKIHYIGKFIVHRSFNLFPINYILGREFEGLINEEVPESQQNYAFKEQYILSNIVAAICLQVGYDGIVYRSTKDNISVDYAIFNNYKKTDDIEILEVET